MTYKEFQSAMLNIKAFLAEQQKLTDVVKILSANDGYSEFGSFFLDNYIVLLETIMNDEYSFISWYVFENDFGKNEFEARLGDFPLTKIKTIKQLYELIK